MFRDRILGLISVLRDQIGSYNELNCWVAPSPMHLSRVVLDLAEGDMLLLCSDLKNSIWSLTGPF